MTNRSDIVTAFRTSTDPETTKHVRKLGDVALAKSIDCLREREANKVLREALERIKNAPPHMHALIAEVALDATSDL